MWTSTACMCVYVSSCVANFQNVNSNVTNYKQIEIEQFSHYLASLYGGA